MSAVRVCQLDGSLPNIALMRLSAWHRKQGDRVEFFSGDDAVERKFWEPRYQRVYASSIFKFSEPLVARFMEQWPDAVVGGTGTDSALTVEDIVGEETSLDYEIYPRFAASIGFSQRGCRLKCPFCVVPKKEGKARSAATVAELWRGDPHPRQLHLLDNDFFGNPEWRERIAEIRDGRFQVCFSQGINLRKVDAEVAAALASIRYRSTDFGTPRLYTAWDNLGDEAHFFRGVDLLEEAGVPPRHLMTYMLVGFDKRETWDRIWHRFNCMVARGIRPYPMVFDRSREDLKRFQRWVVTAQYRKGLPFEDYDASAKKGDRPKGHPDLFAGAAE